MKNIITLLLLILAITTFSCNQSKSKDQPIENKSTQQEVAANYKSIEVEIEGMTCEIGCARLIQSKLSKVDGITYTKVSFESGKGQFTFDTNKLSNDAIAKKIASIAGGDLYSVSKTTAIDLIVDKNSDNK